MEVVELILTCLAYFLEVWYQAEQPGMQRAPYINSYHTSQCESGTFKTATSVSLNKKTGPPILRGPIQMLILSGPIPNHGLHLIHSHLRVEHPLVPLKD
jgi:hypothetical protein